MEIKTTTVDGELYLSATDLVAYWKDLGSWDPVKLQRQVQTDAQTVAVFLLERGHTTSGKEPGSPTDRYDREIDL